MPSDWLFSQGEDESPFPDQEIPGAIEYQASVIINNHIAPNEQAGYDSSLDHRELAQHRRTNWPRPSHEMANQELAAVYKQVLNHGTPNAIDSKIPIKTKLNVGLWEQCATGHIDDEIVIAGIKYGFSMQYLGPTLDEVKIEMHESGNKHQSHIADYISTEKQFGAVLGPFKTPPFQPWCRTSPLMTRPKAESNKRRVIVDLSYPPDKNVNAWVIKGNYYGRYVHHKLPKIEDVIEVIVQKGFQVALATIDIKRAYRNFPGCPLDYPLNVIKFQGNYFLDCAMPFGARTSSMYMQKAANMISRALEKRGILTHVYLDDVVLYFLPDQDPQARMSEALDFMKALGLPLAEEKVQSPATKVKYLGIWFDVTQRSINMPSEKIQKFLDLIGWIMQQDSVTKKVIQTLVGKVIHITSCVPAARNFINRVLMALRQSHLVEMVQVDEGLNKDLQWFVKFLNKFNGRSMMKPKTPQFVIEADACLKGGGATDFKSYIAYTFPLKCERFHISILEALNCLVACRALITKEKHSSVILIKCDNQATIECLSKGTARDPYMAAISRAMWYVMARADVTPAYRYTPGELMTIPDALSRRTISATHRSLADNIIESLNLQHKEFKPYYLDFADFL